MRDENCEKCRFWDNSIQASNAQPDTTGACRVHAPVADDRDHTAVWPFTDDTDWCGQWMPATNGTTEF